MHVERLTILADKLDTIPDEKFDMSVWCLETIFCGTVGCAGGHACEIPEFQQAGLMFGPWVGQGECRRRAPAYQGVSGIHSLLKFFELTDWEVTSIFTGDGYPDLIMNEITPKVVADRIRYLIAQKEAVL